MLALLGRNGVGKTTALRAVMGACAVQSGAVEFAGQSLVGLPSYEINRRGIALVPEGRRLFPNLTVAENLQLAMRPGGASLEDAYALFPKLRARQHAKAQKSLRRRAADGRDRPRAGDSEPGDPAR